jgi:hypothetical protein
MMSGMHESHAIRGLVKRVRIQRAQIAWRGGEWW